MTKKALGKGLAAFLPDDYGILKDERFAEVDVEAVRPNPLQPRLKFNPKTLDELSQSMRESGVIQPILVVPEEDHYRIIVGERRWRAAQKAGLKKIPVIIRLIPHEKQLEISMVENLHREDLNPLEIALVYERMIQELKYTQEEIADRVGKDRTSVTNYLRLLTLPKEVQDQLVEEKISMGHARALVSLDEPHLQAEICRRVVQNNLTVRDVERLITRIKNRASFERKKAKDADLLALQEELVKLLGTKVAIQGSRNRGVIKIFYFSLDDLNRIFGQIKGV